ncbi:hypothetical protein MBCUT_20000 [Methanobrevibacter cuticularis]|uniref:Uncharacterized protein n=1 Tax=Methanobrevibacter cuticularis TaxID=47311 RepID=A0A166CKM9_9EURY|nr:hypothetical protein [Methanobrevibacter cuticularis]KZX14610.1 hypothetical protein MBCUT_20000 [Methanobrevibacter cuticularis]
MSIYKDSKGVLFSTDFLLGLFLFIIAIGMMINIIDNSDDKILNSLEVNNLERLTSEIADYLINNPGSPENWENLNDYNDVSPGLAIRNGNNDTIINSISFKKIKILENEQYETLIDRNIFNDEIKSSIAIYPFNENLDPITIGNDVINKNISNVVVVNRTITCDFLSSLALVSIINENRDIIYDKLCNHDIIDNGNDISELDHVENQDFIWICKEFKVKRSELENNNYYLLFNKESTKINSHWILDSSKTEINIENSITSPIINLNRYFEDNLANESSLIFYLHCKVPKKDKNKFECVLASVPYDLNLDNINIDYFKTQNSYFILKTWYE